MKKILALLLIFGLIGLGGAIQQPLRGDLEQLSTDVTTDATGAGVTVAALNGLQADVDSLETGLIPSMATDSAPASYVTAAYEGTYVTFTANPTSYGGTVGNSVDIALLDPGEETGACSVAVSGTVVNVTLSSTSEAINATGQDVIDCVNANATSAALVSATNTTGKTGADTVAAFAAQDLSGGVNGTAGTVGQLYYYNGDLFYLVSGSTYADATWAQWDGADTDGTPTSSRSFTTTTTVTAEQLTSTDDATIAGDASVGGTLTVGAVVGTTHIVTIPISAASVDTYAFVSDGDWTIASIKEIHAVAGNDTSPANVTITVCDDTEAPSAGLPCHNTTIDLKGTAATIQEPTLSLVAANYTLANNDTLGVDFSGTLTTLAGGTITIEMVKA